MYSMGLFNMVDVNVIHKNKEMPPTAPSISSSGGGKVEEQLVDHALVSY
jgi:hypothetical protein